MGYLLKSFLMVLFISIFTRAQTGTLSGVISNTISNEPLISCNIFTEDLEFGTTSDYKGRFSLQLPYGEYKIKFSYVGFLTEERKIIVSGASKQIYLNIKLNPSVLEEDEITVTAQKNTPLSTVQNIPVKEISKIPSVYSDVLRSVQILSGVSTNNELSSGYNVRGGTFEENLIYLNGYEIYRPFLLRQGVEENQSLINQDLVSELKFYNGAFPAEYGDKMSSALEVNYSPSKIENFSGTIRADLMNMGLTYRGQTAGVIWGIGIRGAYPSLFLSSMQTSGDYKPFFSDIQLIAEYPVSINSSLEFFTLYADNKYDLSPNEWKGHFRSDRSTGFASQVSIFYDGARAYSFNTRLAGLKYKNKLAEDFHLTISAAGYWTSEKDRSDLSGDIYYSPDATSFGDDKEYLYSRYENSDNSFDLASYELKANINAKYGMHHLSGGIETKLVNLKSKVDEYYIEKGESAFQTSPKSYYISRQFNLNSYALFIQDDFRLSSALQIKAGVRYLHYSYNNENLVSPRAGIFYYLNDRNILSFNWGYYYQPPFFGELTSMDLFNENLKSQRAIHYIVSWEYQLKKKVKFQTQVYYKDLKNLIPFYYEDLRMHYYGGNTHEGYAYGLDFMFQGEISDGMQSWIGYGYLDTRERGIGSSEYRRRLLDQTHTLQIFLQDKFKKHRNWQSHLRLLFGSGFLYNYRVTSTNPNTGDPELKVLTDNPQEFLIYMRADMGLSAAFDIGNYKLTIVTEVLNVFNHYNIAGYEWMMVFKDFPGAVKIPKILSKRFFNVRFELSF